MLCRKVGKYYIYIKTLILRFFFGRRLTFRWWENDLNHWPICSTDVTANLPFRGSKIVTNALMKWPSQSYQQNHDVETSISTTPQQELWISKNDLERICENHSIMAILGTVPMQNQHKNMLGRYNSKNTNSHPSKPSNPPPHTGDPDPRTPGLDHTRRHNGGPTRDVN